MICGTHAVFLFVITSQAPVYTGAINSGLHQAIKQGSSCCWSEALSLRPASKASRDCIPLGSDAQVGCV